MQIAANQKMNNNRKIGTKRGSSYCRYKQYKKKERVTGGKRKIYAKDL